MLGNPGHTVHAVLLLISYCQEDEISIQCVPRFFDCTSEMQEKRQFLGRHAFHIYGPTTVDVACADFTPEWVYGPVFALHWYYIHMRKQEQRTLGPIARQSGPEARTTWSWLNDARVNPHSLKPFTDVGDGRPFVARGICSVALDKRLKVFYCFIREGITIEFCC
jgi:hypothetical protein